ncbi:M20/M25/M40 family metallo-hydrolase [Hymenobacter sp. BT188]|uniref:M20/M25/M40 family metallo-hydrolase n=1 Tax=Hymenobacter sp. BT188 TaxID=2763504 RepID=UPI0016511649|nr:M20/M25/M40 family metallo-hydrolase [Hymenobacter sp. BT188]MBC6607704.1 M20/M25/M40 family metallo-hydrolase [Hymenobacter sp. BT188]
MKKLVLILGLAFISQLAEAQKNIKQANVERVIRTLAADDMKGRAAGKPGGLQAAKFLAAEFDRIGLEKMPGLTTYEQVFPAYEVHTVAGSVTLNGSVVAPENVLPVSGLPSLNWTSEDATPPRVVIIGPQDNVRQQMGALLQPTANTLVFVDPAHTERFKQLAGYLSHSNMQGEQPKPFASVFVLAAAPAAPIKFAATATTTIKTVELRNVVGVLPGQAKDKARAAEMVVFSAHYDHIGTLPAVAGDSIANGADDDASGTTAVVALAEYFKKNKLEVGKKKKKNQRTLVFVAFTAEEIGGFGSKYFSQQIDPQKVVAMFNIEMIGKEAKFGPQTAFITGYERSDFGKLLQQKLEGTPFRFEPDPYPEQNLFYRSDNATLARLGVPAHTISSDQIPTDKLYHTVDDEVESLNMTNMTAIISAIARSATGIIAGEQTPTRIEPASVGQRP